MLILYHIVLLLIYYWIRCDFWRNYLNTSHEKPLSLFFINRANYLIDQSTLSFDPIKNTELIKIEISHEYAIQPQTCWNSHSKSYDAWKKYIIS